MVKARKGTITEQDIKEAALNDLHFERATNNITLFERVKELEKVAADENKALEDVIKENVHPSDRNKALELAGYITRNETPYIKEDGTICLKVEKWQDAAKVTEEELTEQLRTMDEELREAATKNKTGEIIRDGDSALSLMDKTVRETWENRKYIGKNKDLTLTNAKDIITYYKDKFKIDNNIKIKFVDGLGADGSTSGTSYLGKGKGKLPDILIQMDKNAKNPYATLRSEIEHARDLAKGQVPDQKVQHLSRYKGLNEAEIAPIYIKKKADSAQARNISLDDYKLQETKSNAYGIQEADGEPYTMAVVKKADGTPLAHLRYTVDTDGAILIEDMQNKGIEKGSARKLVAKLLQEKPDTTVRWIATNLKSVSSYNNFVKEFPDLAKRIDFINRVDSDTPMHYTSGKGANNAETHSLQGEQLGRIRQSDNKGNELKYPDNKDVRESTGDISGTGQGSNTQRRVETLSETLEQEQPTIGNNKGRDDSPLFPDTDSALENSNNTGRVQAEIPAKSLTETLDDTLTGKVPLDEITLEDILLKAEKEIPVSGRTFEAVKNDSEHLAETLMKLKDEGQTALLEAFYKNPQAKFKIRLRAQVKILVTALSRRRNCAD